MATATKKATGFGVCCFECGESDCVTIDLADLGRCVCSSCDNEFSVEEAVTGLAKKLERWQAVARWVAMADSAMRCE